MSTNGGDIHQKEFALGYYECTLKTVGAAGEDELKVKADVKIPSGTELRNN